MTDKVHCAGNVHLLLFAEASAHTLCGRRVIAYYPERCAGLTGSSAPIKCTTVPARDLPAMCERIEPMFGSRVKTRPMAAIRRTRTHDWLAHIVVMAGVWHRDHSGSTRPANCCRLSQSNSVAWDLSRNVGSQVEGLDGQVSEVSPPTALKSLTQVVAVTRQQISHPGTLQ